MQKVDNVPMLQLDIVWCYFMLRDVSCLEVAGARLEKARLGFERSHGKDSTRFRLLQAGRQADLAMWDLFLPLYRVIYVWCVSWLFSLRCELLLRDKFNDIFGKRKEVSIGGWMEHSACTLKRVKESMEGGSCNFFFLGGKQLNIFNLWSILVLTYVYLGVG